MTLRYAVPGVYYEPRPRAQPRPLARTDVVGFIGFEPRVRDGSTASRLIGKGHDFRIDVIGFQLPAGLLGPERTSVPTAIDFVLSQSATRPPMHPGGSITYALAAILSKRGVVVLDAAQGPASPTSESAPPTDDALHALAAGQPWLRIVNVRVRRSTDGLRVFPTVLPALPPTRCDDWRDFELLMGGLPAADDGTLLARSIRAYFANGGARCHVVTIRRPRFDDGEGMALAIADLVGIAGASQDDATGLERLLRIFEVAIVDAPDLYARQVDPDLRSLKLPPRDRDACFHCCAGIVDDTTVTASGEHAAGGPLFGDAAVGEAQRAMILRCAPERWRVCLLLAAPVELDPTLGVYRGPDAERSTAWRMQLPGPNVDDLAASCAAFYHPWALTQEKIGAPIVELPPTALAAGIMARRDLARGPHVAAANERLIGVVGLSPPVDDAINARIYETPLNINPLRAFPGQGIQLWGARTLSSDRWMRFLSVRRCLSAIERRVMAALRPLVFEANTPTLWFRITQEVLGVLVPVFNAGALRGETAEQAFYVRCDDSNNPPEHVALGQVLCEVGVAIAAPAEYIVFRVGRREAVVDLLE